MELYLAVSNDMYDRYLEAADKYNNISLEQRDSGFDLFTDDDYTVLGSSSQYIKFGVTAACAQKPGSSLVNRAFWLLPRSSISKTPFICSNSKGLIDSGYRGPIMGALRCVNNTDATLGANVRLFQLVTGSAKPWFKVIVVHSVEEFPVPETSRGTGGFGSTGK